MPSPVAHVSAALALVLALGPVAPLTDGGRYAIRVAAVAAFASIAPDLDIALAALHPDGLAWHRGPTHSVVGAAAIGGLCCALGRVRDAGGRVAVTLAAMLHVAFDWSTGEPGAPARYGVPWAWPFSADKSIDPNPWFGAFHIDKAGFLANMWSPRALPVYLGELATAGGLLVAGWAVRRARLRRR